MRFIFIRVWCIAQLKRMILYMPLCRDGFFMTRGRSVHTCVRSYVDNLDTFTSKIIKLAKIKSVSYN